MSFTSFLRRASSYLNLILPSGPHYPLIKLGRTGAVLSESDSSSFYSNILLFYKVLKDEDFH